jgi:Ca2+-binding RTX toxin-like protein
MALQPSTQNGISFLVGDNTAESIILSSGQLSNYPGGLLALDGNDTVIGSENSEFVNGNTGSDSLIGNGGIDTLRGGKQDDILDGGSGNDFLAGDLDQDIVRGGEGNDSLYGGKNSDQLFGDAGDDILSGDKDNDTLTGGTGKDTFVLVTDGGLDVITDFENSTDIIKLPDGVTFNDILLQSLSGNTLVTVKSTGEQLAQINNISISNLTAASFGGTTSNIIPDILDIPDIPSIPGIPSIPTTPVSSSGF